MLRGRREPVVLHAIGGVYPIRPTGEAAARMSAPSLATT